MDIMNGKKKLKKYPIIFIWTIVYFFFGGLFNDTSGCCIVTKEAEKSLADIHSRQPVIIEESNKNKWLNEEYNFEYLFESDITFHKVSNRVNSPKNNSPENRGYTISISVF